MIHVIIAVCDCSSIIEARSDNAAGQKRYDYAKMKEECKIKRCCASCQHKEIDDEGTRICITMQLKVEKRFRCPRWKLSDQLAKSKLPPRMFYGIELQKN